MGAATDLESRILDCLEEKPRSISEIARELDEEKYEISKKIEVLAERGSINTYRIGRSTACILNTDDGDDQTGEADAGEGSNVQDPADAETEQPDDTEDVRGERTDSGEGQDPPLDPEDPLDRNQEPEPPWSEDPEEWFNQGTRSDMDDPFQENRSGRQHSPGSGGVAGGNTGAGNRSQPAGTRRSRQGDGPRTIGIVSGKGGVGKTVVTLNLGAAMMELGENVIVIDSDAEMPNVGLHLGMYTPPTSLQQVVEQDMHIMSAMHVDKDSGIRVIPTALGREPVQAHVDTAIDMLPDEYHVLIDSPPGLERPVERVIETCDDLLFVTVPEIPAVTDTFKLYQEARSRGKNVLGAVVNMYSSPKKHLSVAEVEKTLEMPVLGVIDHSKTIQRSIFDTQPAVSMDPHAKPSREFKRIAAELTGNQYDPTLVEKLKGLLP